MENNILEVVIWNRRVGTLQWDTKERRAKFLFYKDFLSSGWDLSPLENSIYGIHATRGLYIGGNKDKIYAGLPPFIADSLPEHWGNILFKRWAEEEGLSLKNLTSVDKLAFIGKRGMGALEFIPQTPDIKDKPFDLHVERLYRMAELILDERKKTIISNDEIKDLQHLYQVGTSAGGKHSKALIAIDEKTGKIRSGQVSLPASYKYYIIKFAEKDRFPFCEVEYAYYLMATAAGIEMMPSKLIEAGERNHFITERFDRKNGEKIHTQTLAAIRPDVDSYEELLGVCNALKLPMNEIEQQYRRMVFNVLAGNVDDHSKNFSFMMDKDGKWHLAPAYDITFTIDMDAWSLYNRHCLTVCGKDDEIKKDDIFAFAKNLGIRNAKRIIEEVEESIKNFRQFAEQAKVQPQWIDRIDEWLKKD